MRLCFGLFAFWLVTPLEVAFAHALGMVTGIGDIAPIRVPEYVEVDGSRRAMAVWSMVLAAAIEAYFRQNEVPQADNWQSMIDEMFAQMGINRIPIKRTMEPDGRTGTPRFYAGLLVTREEAIKVVGLLQNNDAHNSRQLLHR